MGDDYYIFYQFTNHLDSRSYSGELCLHPLTNRDSCIHALQKDR